MHMDSTEAQSQEFAIWSDFETMLQPCSECKALNKEVKLIEHHPLCFDCFCIKHNEKMKPKEENMEE